MGNNPAGTALAAAAGGIVLGIAGSIGLFTWRITEHLTEMSSGIILGLVAAALLFTVGVLPLSYLLLRSRQADFYEFLASQGRTKPTVVDYSPSLQLGTGEPQQFGAVLPGMIRSFRNSDEDIF